MSLIYSASAKINLYLHILNKYPDGFHQLESLVTFCNIADVITFNVANTTTLTVTGEFAKELPNSRDNLIYKIIKYFQKWNKNFNLQVDLIKNIPIGAGLGGGSADCAKTILACNELLKLNLSEKEILAIASDFGADVPVCIKQQNSYIVNQGIEVIPTVLPKEPIYILLVNPKEKLLTSKVFQNFNQDWKTPDNSYPCFRNNKDLFTFLNSKDNSLTESAIIQKTIIENILHTLNTTNANLVRMTGSGATCFALYTSKSLLRTAKVILKKKYPNFWIKDSFLI